MLALAGCSPIGVRQSVAPQHSLARDGGTRITLSVACLPSTPACDVTRQRDAAIRVISQRLSGRSDVHDSVVRADGAANIIAELPEVTGDTQVAAITAMLTESGAIAILDTGDDFLPIGTSTAGKTCTHTCAAGQYRIAFTGDQIDHNKVAAVVDQQSDKWVVQFEFAGSARPQFAEYTASHIGQSLTITFDDRVIESAVIQSEIDGSGQIMGMDQPEARQLAADLESGSLPAIVTVISSELVSPGAN